MDVKKAIVSGFAETDLHYPTTKPFIPPKWVSPTVAKSVVTVAQYPPVEPYKKVDPTTDNAAQEYFEDSLIERVTPSPYVGFYELARLYVPQGKIGVVRQAWQWLELTTPIAPPPVGTPYDALTHTRSANQIDILWQLRLFQGQLEGDRIKEPNGSIPNGYGYPNFANWRELRFPWGSCAPVFWLIPENFTLIMYADIQVGKDFVAKIGARLAGYRQTIDKAATWNTRHGWQW